MPKKLVAVAMSGGVDSSVTAAILKKQGYQVFGLTMQIEPDSDKSNTWGCCSSDEIDSARQVAAKLGIPHYVRDFRGIFARKVITTFCNEYGRGRTPNPCIICNHYVKFGALLNKARELGADFMATGHYARIESSPEGYRLLKGVDRTKDQSYFLYNLGQEQLRYLLLPIGHLHKSKVKEQAVELGLADAVGIDSQDICFIPDNDHNLFIREHITSQPGDIIDVGGKTLGRHKGLAYYTVGQRQGLGLASNRRLYVIKLDAGSNRLVVGGRDQLFTSRLFASRLSWISGKAPEVLRGIMAKVRYKSPEVAASLCLDNNSAEVRFAQPQWAVAPGQSIVFYRGEEVLGGGVIEASETLERDKTGEHSIHAILC